MTDILTKIKEEIHTVQLSQSLEKKSEESTVMEIYFTFDATYDNKPITAIGFLTGNEHNRTSTSNSYELNEYINFSTINQLITYLLNEYPHINNFSVYPMNFSLEFNYPLEKKYQEGISCDKIILEFNILTNEFMPLLKQYLSNILIKFTNELSQTSTFKYKYEEYCNNLQMNILDSLNEKEIEQMIKILPIEIKREMLKNLSSQCFFKYYQEQNSNEDTLIKQLIKNE